jgi:hypothetical protein
VERISREVYAESVDIGGRRCIRVGGETHWAETQREHGDPARAQQTTVQAASASPIWERLEIFVRDQGLRVLQAVLDDTLPTIVHHPATLVAEGINLALIDDQDCRDDAAIDTWANDIIHVRSLECMLSLSTMFG